MRLDYYLLGYRCFTVREEDKALAVTALLKRNLSARINQNGEIAVPIHRTEKYKKALKKTEFTVSDIKGLPSLFLKYRFRYGIIAGIMLIFVYILFSSSFVWDIRVEGNEEISASAVEEELSACGFYVGAPWRSKELSEIETGVLEKSDSIGWININRRGNVAYVTVRGKSVYENKDEGDGFSNIVAARDCVIEEITVRRGIACVKAGDTVKAGELLISGVIPAELGGGFVRADGDVFGIISEKIEVSVPKEEITKTYSDAHTKEISLKIFNFSLKLFKKYGNVGNDCVIIEDEKEFVLFGKYRIPFGIRKVYVSKATEKTVQYTDKEMIDIARARLNLKRAQGLRDADVIRLQTVGGLTDTGYTITTYATVLKDIGEEKYFFKKER